ncbi:tripartite motif-containing protein 45-like [Crassostrea angulata]|uniref:tripartite motif-containing protein 45-like n=1 Tax=Magallana angulata TaxID=2784310 RepID=UPI0022B20F92|nr:tripartite motif-containing protein 45-like [Crassostrea angulata]
MAESTSVEPEKEPFRCPICLERLNIPRYLPCLHTFCEVCIQTYISSSTTRDKEDDFNIINCPVCRQQVKEPVKDISSEDWVKELPVNKWAWTMTFNSEKNPMKHCMFCKREELTVLATQWCKSCVEPLCEDCKRFHTRVPILQGHKIVEISQMEKWSEAVDIEETCVIHRGRTVDIFCKDHNDLCCGVCFANRHKRCANFDSIDAFVMSLDKDQIKDKLKLLSSLHDCITVLQEENKRQIAVLCTSKEDICSSFANRIEEAKMYLDQAHEQWLKRFEVEHAHQTDQIEVVLDELKRFDITVTEARSMLSSVLDNGSDKQIFIIQSKVNGQILSHFNRLKSLDIWDLTESYGFDTNQLDNITDSMKFEDVILSKRPSDAPKRISVQGKSLFLGLPTSKPWLEYLDLMSSTFHEISSSKIKGLEYFALYIDDVNVVISDENALKVYNTCTEKLINTHHCDSKPFDICHAYSMNRIYVAFGTFVVLYEINNQGMEFIELEKIQVEGVVQGIARTIDGFFTANESSVSFRCSDFTIKFYLPYVKPGARPFICSSFFGRKVAYTTDREVIVMDTKGNKLSEYSCSGIYPTGLSFDSNDNIIVCSYSSLPKQIKFDGTSRRSLEIGNGQGYFPRNIIFHPEGHKFITISVRTSLLFLSDLIQEFEIEK